MPVRARCTVSITCRRRTPRSATSSWRTRVEGARSSRQPEETRMRIALAGAGAFGVKHLEAIARIDGVEVVSLVGRTLEPTQEVARRFGVGHVTTELAHSLARRDVDAVILCTPTQIHASQAIQCLEAGKHVQVEIPLADKLSDAEEVVRLQRE